MIDQKNLKSLIKLMVENDLTELDLADKGGERVTIKRARGETVTQYVPAPVTAAPVTTKASAPAPADEDASLSAIKSPMVGTFYASPSPDAKAFVQVGDRVTPETVVCIIEAMKVFNEIRAETSGVVAKVVAVSGKAVEFGQPLFMIKPE